jgi:hypothetical protein
MFGSAWVKTAVSINKSFSSKCNMHRFLFAFSAQNNMHYFRQFGFSSVLVQLNHFHRSRHHGNLKNNNACMDGAQKQKVTLLWLSCIIFCIFSIALVSRKKNFTHLKATVCLIKLKVP